MFEVLSGLMFKLPWYSEPHIFRVNFWRHDMLCASTRHDMQLYKNLVLISVVLSYVLVVSLVLRLIILCRNFLSLELYKFGFHLELIKPNVDWHDFNFGAQIPVLSRYDVVWNFVGTISQVWKLCMDIVCTYVNCECMYELILDCVPVYVRVVVCAHVNWCVRVCSLWGVY